MPSKHLIFCQPLLLSPSIFPSIRVFSNESVLPIRWPQYWSFNFSISASSEYSGLISFRMDWLDLLAVQGTLKSLLQYHSSKASILRCSTFFIVQLSHSYMTIGKTIALTRWTFVGKEMYSTWGHKELDMTEWLRLHFTPQPRADPFQPLWLMCPTEPSTVGTYLESINGVLKSIHLDAHIYKFGVTKQCSWGFPGGLVVKNLPASAGDTGDMGSFTGMGRSRGGGNGNPLQYSCLENPINRGHQQAYSPWGRKE